MFDQKAEGHYKPFDGGRMRFYLSGHGYFAVGEKVRYPGVYAGVERCTVAEAYDMPHGNGAVMYRVRYKLPKGHPDAHDESGRPQFTKYAFARDTDLTRYNPEAEN